MSTINNCKVVEKFDPTVAADDFAPPEIKTAIKGAFLRQVSGIITTSQSEIVKKSYSDWLTSLNLPLPTATPTVNNTHIADTSATSTEVEPIPQLSHRALEKRPQAQIPTTLDTDMDVEPAPISENPSDLC